MVVELQQQLSELEEREKFQQQLSSVAPAIPPRTRTNPFNSSSGQTHKRKGWTEIHSSIGNKILSDREKWRKSKAPSDQPLLVIWVLHYSILSVCQNSLLSSSKALILRFSLTSVLYHALFSFDQSDQWELINASQSTNEKTVFSLIRCKHLWTVTGKTLDTNKHALHWLVIFIVILSAVDSLWCDKGIFSI